MTASTADRTSLLRRALQLNGAFSGASGVALIVGASPLAAFLGIPNALVLAAIGAGLLVYAAGLWRNARRDAIRVIEARVAVAMDVAWVVGSGLVLVAFAEPIGLTVAGKWCIALVADVVLAFAVAQMIGLRRLTARAS